MGSKALFTSAIIGAGVGWFAGRFEGLAPLYKSLPLFRSVSVRTASVFAGALTATCTYASSDLLKAVVKKSVENPRLTAIVMGAAGGLFFRPFGNLGKIASIIVGAFASYSLFAITTSDKAKALGNEFLSLLDGLVNTPQGTVVTVIIGIGIVSLIDYS